MIIKNKAFGSALTFAIAGLLLTSCATDTSASSLGGSSTPDDGQIIVSDYNYLANIENTEDFADPSSGDSVPWAVLSINRNSPVLFVAYWENDSCSPHLGVNVVETEESITIAAINKATTSTKCVSSSTLGGGYFQLHDIVGERALLHADVTGPWGAAQALPTESPEPTPPARPAPVKSYSGSATCDSLIGEDQLASFEEKGYVDVSDQVRDATLDEPNLTTRMILEFGGQLCAWGEPRGDIVSIYGYGPISAAEKSKALETFRERGYVENPNVEKFDSWSETSGGLETWVIGSDYWALDVDNGAGAVIQDIIANAPKFG